MGVIQVEKVDGELQAEGISQKKRQSHENMKPADSR